MGCFLLRSAILQAVLAVGIGTAAAAEEAAPPAHPVERSRPDPRDLRPLQIPLTPSDDRAQRRFERSKIEGERRRIERTGDRHNPRTQDRLRRLDRASDRFR